MIEHGFLFDQAVLERDHTDSYLHRNLKRFRRRAFESKVQSRLLFGVAGLTYIPAYISPVIFILKEASSSESYFNLHSGLDAILRMLSLGIIGSIALAAAFERQLSASTNEIEAEYQEKEINQLLATSPRTSSIVISLSRQN